jgi:hypothetical protein
VGWLGSEPYAVHGLDELDLRRRDGEIVDVAFRLGFGSFADGQDHHINLLPRVSQSASPSADCRHLITRPTRRTCVCVCVVCVCGVCVSDRCTIVPTL